MTTFTPIPGKPPGVLMDRGSSNQPRAVPANLLLYRQTDGSVAICDPAALTPPYVTVPADGTEDDLTAAVAALSGP